MRTLKTLKWWAVPAATLVIAIGVAAGPTEATKRAVVPAPVAATVLTEDPTCALPKVPATTAPAGATADAGDHTATVAVKVTVTVPAVAWIELDAEGRLVAAATNTRCAPRDGDKLAVRGPDRRLLTDVTIDLAAIHWVGDFTEPGVLVPQADHVLIAG